MKKTKKNQYKGTLVDCVLVPITDPAEIAALDERVRAAEKRLAEAHAPPRKRKAARGK